MTARDRIAQQMGQLVLASIEQQVYIEELQAKLQETQQRLHEAAADNAGPSGQVPPPDACRGS